MDAKVALLDLRKTFHTITLRPKSLAEGKLYKSFTATRGVCLKMGESQCFALLGHNGAGKTTTIKMVTGQIEPTAGDALIDGCSVNKETAAVRRVMGLCPQHDILYDELTAREHLCLFGALKGVPQATLDAEIPGLCASHDATPALILPPPSAAAASASPAPPALLVAPLTGSSAST